MNAIPLKTSVIYLQIILFIVGSFGMLVQNASATTCHLHGNVVNMQMDGQVMMDHGQMNHNNEKCCDSCNCVGQHCMINCSMLGSFATFINIADNVLLHHDNPVSTVPGLVGIVHLPERHPPRLTVL